MWVFILYPFAATIVRDWGFRLGEEIVMGRSGEKTEMLCDDERFNGVDFFANCERQTELVQEGVFRRGFTGVESEVQLKNVEDAIVVILVELCVCALCG